MLRNGSQGEEVMTLQKRLTALGMSAGPADGIFGPQTEAAVKECQEKCGVTADGIWGPASQAAFDEMVAKVRAARAPESAADAPGDQAGPQ